MLEALLHGKLSREIEGMEDVLTSTVFGLLKYENTNLIIKHFLEHAETISGIKLTLDLPEVFDVEYNFWTNYLIKYGNEAIACEPDLVLTIDNKYVILIEVKYHSGKSGSGIDDCGIIKDQITREYINLISHCGTGMIPILIYLTKDYAFPTDDIKTSFDTIETVLNSDELKKAKNIVYWLSWRDLTTISIDSIILDDIKKLIGERLGMQRFSGITINSGIINKFNFMKFYFSNIGQDIQCKYKFRRIKNENN